jgi:tetratricopeptide (TPR) repeat protein
VAYYNWGSYAEAIKACRKAIQINRAYPNSYYLLGLIYIDLMDKEMALEAQRTLQELDPETSRQLLEQIYKQL